MDSNDEEGDSDSETEDGSYEDPEGSIIYGENGTDVIVVESDSEDAIVFGSADEQDGVDHRDSSEFSEAGDGKADQIVSEIIIDELEAATYIDSWNYDAVYWYTKSDQLAVQNFLENQIVSADAFAF